MKRYTLWGLALILVLGTIAINQPGWGQQITASITGTVEDASGAALNEASVTARDTERGTSSSTKATQGGVFNFNNLPIGTYEVKAEAPGFDTVVQPPLTLVLNQRARIDFKMKVGATTNTVQVSSEAPQLQADTTQVSTLIDANTITGIPLATRNYVELTLLAPGSITPDNASFNNGDNTSAGGRPSIDGHREQSDNFILDGMDNNQTSENQLGFTPSPDAIQEFNLITSNAPAEFGNYAGGIINASIKSGTNQFHGDAWEFFRNDVLNANQWENKFNGPGNFLPRGALRWNMFGGTLGGPVLKDKLFFFVDYQGQRFDHPTTTMNMTVFTNAERAGDFSQLLPTQLKAPKGGAPYVNNQIPISQINPVAAALFASSYYPKPINNNLTNNATYQQNQAFNSDQGDAKVDWNITQKDRLSARYSQAYQNDPLVKSLAILGNTSTKAPVHNAVGSWTHTFGPNILNEARVGASWITITQATSFVPGIGDLGSQLGIANANTAGPGLLLLGFDGGTAPQPNSAGTLTNVGNAVVNQNFADTVIQFDDGVTVTRGKHVFKAGFQMWRFRLNTFYSGNSGEYGSILFGGAFTGDPASDFFTGFPGATGKGVSTGGTWHQFAWRFGGYGQDDWRITPTLTLNLGLRYEASTPWVELHNLQDNLDLVTGALEYAGQNGNSRSLYKSEYGLPDVQPRVGFAWSPANLKGKTVLRGAYTISSYLEGTGTNLRLARNPPFTPTEVTATYNVATVSTQSGPGGQVAGDPFKGAVMYVWDKKVQPQMDQQWNMTVQSEASATTTFQIGYVGQHGTHLIVPMPYLQGTLNNGVVGPTQFFRGNPDLINELSQVSGTASTGFSTYHALQAVLQKRISNGLEGQVAYTWSHCMSNNIGYYGSGGPATQAVNGSPYYQNLYDPHADYASCYFDSRNILATYATYDLPIGRGKMIGKNLNPVVNSVVGGWQASTIVSLHSGFPLAVFQSTDTSGTNSRGPRPNCSTNQMQTFGRQPSINGGSFQGYQYLSPAGYSTPATGSFGNCPLQGPQIGPGYADTDIGLSKSFHLTEQKYFQFRGDFLNAFNNVQLGAPSTTFPSATFGLISKSQPARNIQFALKFYY
jgi:Carboxypeptidase regulatory-like domain